MSARLSSRWMKVAPRWRARRRPSVELLESRTLLRGGTLATAAALTFGAADTAEVSGFLADSGQADLYRLQLVPGDRINATVSSQEAGGGLTSLLRVFDARGRQLALDDQEGGDPALTFQAAAAGDYYLGVSSAPNDAYDPTLPRSGGAGAGGGLYELSVRLTAGAAQLPDLTGGSFRLGADAAAYGEAVPVMLTVENRGGADAGAFDVQVVLSPDDRFGPASQVLRTFTLPGLRSGQAFSPGTVLVPLPDLAGATAAGLPVSGPAYLGLRIDPTGGVPELNPFEQSGVHRGSDWEALTIVTPVTARGTNYVPASADLLADPNSRVGGTLTAGENWYQLRVSDPGRLTAQVAPAGGSSLVPRLTLAGAEGQVLIQSDGGTIAQHVQPGSYFLAVSAQAGTGRYQLTSEFVPASPPLKPVGVGDHPRSVVLADVNGDGRPDLVAANQYDGTVSVLLGNGDGSFQPRPALAVGYGPRSVAVADVNGDGKPDLVVANYGDNTVSVLLGNGNGSFQPQPTVPVGAGPSAVVAADVNGDGRPDLVVADYGDAAVDVLLGNGDGTFGPEQTFPTGPGPRAVQVADVNGDGEADLIVADYGDAAVSLLVGSGDGSFVPQ